MPPRGYIVAIALFGKRGNILTRLPVLISMFGRLAIHNGRQQKDALGNGRRGIVGGKLRLALLEHVQG